MNKLLKPVFLLMLLFCSTFLFAQDKVAMAEGMRSDGRIYVVVAVMVTILLGLVLYLIRLDRKMSKLEKDPA
jgi:hypothetical protein